MFKKIASLFLAATMITGTAAISASAAEAEDADVAAADDSSVVAAADGSSDVAAEDGSSDVGASKVLNFDVKSAGWENLATAGMFCYIYDVATANNNNGWQAKAGKCTYDASTGIATYDIQTGLDRGCDFLNNIGSANEWAVIFCTKSGAETYPTLLNSSCFGDTLYCPDKTKLLENNVDSDKQSVEAKWKNSGLGAALCITSTGKIQGDSLAAGESKETILASFLIGYALDADKLAYTQDLVNELNVSPVSVMAIVKSKEADAVSSGSKTQDIVDQELASIEKTLGSCTDPTKGGAKVSEDDIKNVEASKTGSSSGSSSSGSNSSGSSSSGSGSSSSGSSSSGSGSVSSGQETTIFFVFGGLMLAAAGVMFLARKKREE